MLSAKGPGEFLSIFSRCTVVDGQNYLQPALDADITCRNDIGALGSECWNCVRVDGRDAGMGTRSVWGRWPARRLQKRRRGFRPRSGRAEGSARCAENASFKIPTLDLNRYVLDTATEGLFVVVGDSNLLGNLQLLFAQGCRAALREG